MVCDVASWADTYARMKLVSLCCSWMKPRGHRRLSPPKNLISLVRILSNCFVQKRCDRSIVAVRIQVIYSRSPQYPRPVTDAYLLELKAIDDGEEGPTKEDSIRVLSNPSVSSIEKVVQRTGDESSQVDNPDVPLRFEEKKRLDWAGKTCKATILSLHLAYILRLFIFEILPRSLPLATL